MKPNSNSENLNGATTHDELRTDASSESVPQITLKANDSNHIPQTETPELPLVSKNDRFWHRPKVLNKDKTEVVGWTAPPIVKGESEKFADLLEKSNPFQAKIIRNREVAAIESRSELESLQVNLVEELDSKNRRIFRENDEVQTKLNPLQTKLETAQNQAFGARKESLEALQAAGLPADAQDIRAAVQAVAPDEAVISGAAGVVRQPSEIPSWVLTWGPIVVGAIVGALTLGPLLNIFYPSDLNNLSDSWPRLLFASICGATLVEILGVFASRFAQNLAPYLLAREAAEVPRRDTFRSGISHRLGAALLGVGLVIAAALLLSAIAEITLGSVGIRMASEEHVTRALRAMSTGKNQPVPSVLPLEPLPWLLCVAVAVVFVSPFLYAKVLGVWSKVENGMISDWIAAQREAWILNRLAEPKVEKAAGALGRERAIKEQITFFLESIATLQSLPQDYQVDLTEQDFLRLEAARVAASGEAGELRESMRVIANATDPIKTERLDLSSGDPIFYPQAQVSLPWWLRLFGRVHRKNSRQSRRENLQSREL